MRQSDNPFWPKKSILNPQPPRPEYVPVRRVKRSLTREEQKLVDQAAMQRFSIPVSILMEHAGLAVADVCEYLAGASTTPVHIFAGKGNNGGDAYVAARLLFTRGFSVAIWDCAPGAKHQGAVRAAREMAMHLGIPIHPAETFNPQSFRSGVSRMINDRVSGIPCVIIDGILGSGYEYTRKLPPYLRNITGLIELSRVRGARVLSIDIPTGVDADNGFADESAVCADCTATFVLPKHGMTIGRGRICSGQIRVFPIGLPINFADIALQ